MREEGRLQHAEGDGSVTTPERPRETTQSQASSEKRAATPPMPTQPLEVEIGSDSSGDESDEQSENMDDFMAGLFGDDLSEPPSSGLLAAPATAPADPGTPAAGPATAAAAPATAAAAPTPAPLAASSSTPAPAAATAAAPEPAPAATQETIPR